MNYAEDTTGFNALRQWFSHPTIMLLLLCAAYPLLWLTTFAFFVLRARLLLGRWPTGNNPDPKALDMEWHRSSLMLGLIAIPAVGLVSFLIALAARVRFRILPWWLVLLMGITPVATVLILRCDPFDFIGWFAD